MAYWRTLRSEDDAVFDKEVQFNAADIEPMITYGTNPAWAWASAKPFRSRSQTLTPKPALHAV